MVATRRLVGAFGLAILLSGCANTNSIHRKNSIDSKGQTQMIDAKQRAIIAVPNHQASTTDRNSDGSERQVFFETPKFRICAEAAPDVFSIFATAATADGNFDLAPGQGSDVAIAAALRATLSSSESGATIERTQTINLMRESMYRTCERYLSGAINADTVKVQAARDQRAMVAILAIEQLTGVVKSQPTILSSETRATYISANKEMLEKHDRDDKDYITKQKAAIEAETTLNTAKGNYQKLHNGECDTILAQSPPKPPKPEDLQSQEVDKSEIENAPDGTVKKSEENVIKVPGDETLNAAAEAADLAKSKSECQAAKTVLSSAQNSLASKQRARDEAKSKLDQTTDLLKTVSATALSAMSSANGTGSSGTRVAGLDQIEAVAKTVERITQSMFSDKSEIIFTCSELILKKYNPDDQAINACLEIIELQSRVNAEAEAKERGVDIDRLLQKLD